MVDTEETESVIVAKSLPAVGIIKDTSIFMPHLVVLRDHSVGLGYQGSNLDQPHSRQVHSLLHCFSSFHKSTFEVRVVHGATQDDFGAAIFAIWDPFSLRMWLLNKANKNAF